MSQDIITEYVVNSKFIADLKQIEQQLKEDIASIWMLANNKDNQMNVPNIELRTFLKEKGVKQEIQSTITINIDIYSSRLELELHTPTASIKYYFQTLAKLTGFQGVFEILPDDNISIGNIEEFIKKVSVVEKLMAKIPIES